MEEDKASKNNQQLLEQILGEKHTRRQFLKTAGAIGGAGLLGGILPEGVSAASRFEAPNRAISGTITARFWGTGEELVDWQKRIDHFSHLYPKVKVIQQHLEKNGYEEFPALLTQIAAGNAPDVIRTLNFQPTQLVAQGKALMPLDNFIKRDHFDLGDFPKIAQAGMKVGKHVYVIPENIDPYGMYYNKTAFQKAGLPDPYQLFKQGKWDEKALLHAATTLKAKGGVKYGIAFEGWTYDTFIFMGGGEVLNGSHKVVIDSSASVRALQFFADLILKYKVAPGPDVAGGAYSEYFKNGDVGMYLMGRWWSPYYIDNLKNFQWGTVPLFRLYGHLGSKIEVDALGIYAKTKNPEAAWAFVKTVTDKTAEQIWSTIGFPSRKSVIHSTGFKRLFYNQGYIPIIPHSRFTPFTSAGAGVDAEVTAALGTLWTGQANAAQAAHDAAQRLKRLLHQT